MTDKAKYVVIKNPVFINNHTYSRGEVVECSTDVYAAYGEEYLAPYAEEVSGDEDASDGYSKLKLDELKAIASERGIEVDGNKKADYIAALEAADGDAESSSESESDEE